MLQDQNDIPPVFLTILTKPLVLNDDTEIGTSVITLTASDADGTAPNNLVSKLKLKTIYSKVEWICQTTFQVIVRNSSGIENNCYMLSLVFK